MDRFKRLFMRRKLESMESFEHIESPYKIPAIQDLRFRLIDNAQQLYGTTHLGSGLIYGVTLFYKEKPFSLVRICHNGNPYMEYRTDVPIHARYLSDLGNDEWAFHIPYFFYNPPLPVNNAQIEVTDEPVSLLKIAPKLRPYTSSAPYYRVLVCYKSLSSLYYSPGIKFSYIAYSGWGLTNYYMLHERDSDNTYYAAPGQSNHTHNNIHFIKAGYAYNVFKNHILQHLERGPIDGKKYTKLRQNWHALGQTTNIAADEWANQQKMFTQYFTS